MDITVDPGLVIISAELKREGAAFTMEVGPEQEGLWSFYDGAHNGVHTIPDIPGIGYPTATQFYAGTGETWYRATVEIGEDVNEKLRIAVRGMCRAWEQAEAEEGSGDSRTVVTERFRELVHEIETWTAYSTREAEPQTPEEILEMIEALDGIEERLPPDPYRETHAPTPEELEDLL